MNGSGCFPFGRPNTVRPARIAERSDAVVVGVYPSAWHVSWTAPPSLPPAGPNRGVAALAVDVEPTVFWDGNTDDFGARLARWKKDVSFIEGKHGSISPVSPSTNGSSGDKVVKHYLTPLGLDPGRVTFTDIHPLFLIKTKTSKDGRREQGDAIAEEYDPIAPLMGMPKCTLPARISKAKLPALAASTFGERLVADIEAAGAPLVITLGEEVWNTLLAISSLRARPPTPMFTNLYGDNYGAMGAITVNGREVAWLPMVHPGLLKGEADPAGEVDVGRRTVRGWGTLHARWASSRRRG